MQASLPHGNELPCSTYAKTPGEIPEIRDSLSLRSDGNELILPQLLAGSVLLEDIPGFNGDDDDDWPRSDQLILRKDNLMTPIF